MESILPMKLVTYSEPQSKPDSGAVLTSVFTQKQLYFPHLPLTSGAVFSAQILFFSSFFFAFNTVPEAQCPAQQSASSFSLLLSKGVKQFGYAYLTLSANMVAWISISKCLLGHQSHETATENRASLFITCAGPSA